MIAVYAKLFDHYLQQLLNEVEQFPPEHLWEAEGSVTNSPGNLVLHLCGNLRNFIGGTLGADGYIRKREEEFSKIVSKQELLDELKVTREVVHQVFASLPEEELQQVRKFQLTSLTEPVTTGYFLAHLAAHLGYHTGQMNYYRRLLG